MATAGALAICSGGAGGPVATSHAAALVFYGLRLCLFLLRRETTTPVEIHQMTRRDASMGDRLKRAPVVVGCSVLYFLMAAPLRITARTSLSSSASLLASSPASLVSLAAAFSGFGLAAWGRRAQIRRQGRAGPGHPRDDGPLPGLPPSELYRRDNRVDREPFRRDVRGRAPLPTVVGRLRRNFCAVRRPVDRRLGTGLGGYVRCSRR